MKRMTIGLLTLILVLGMVMSSHAVLINRGGGMIYSTELNLTWLQDANYAQTSGYDADGLMTWDEAMTWAANLSYGGYDDWRLPTFDPDNASQCDTSKLHEMRYLLYTELGNDCRQSGQNYGPFINVFPDGDYEGKRWSSTEYDTDPSRAWRFFFDCG